MSIQDMTMSDLCDIAEGSLRRLREGDSNDDFDRATNGPLQLANGEQRDDSAADSRSTNRQLTDIPEETR